MTVFISSTFASFIISLTSIIPSVIVPVLSRHNTSVLASVSIQYNSWTKTLYLPSLITDTARTVLVKRTNPSGIIPIRAATVFITALVILLSFTPIWFMKRSIPTGTITIDIYLIILFNDSIRTELGFFKYLASLLIIEV